VAWLERLGEGMNKIELIRALEANTLPDDTEVLISVKKYHEGEATWDEISSIDSTINGPPILISLGETIME